MESFHMESAPKKELYLVPPGSGGHQYDYQFNIEGYGHDTEYIPESLANELRDALGSEWRVDNRGSRLEISHNTEYAKRDDSHVQEAIARVFDPKKHELKILG